MLGSPRDRLLTENWEQNWYSEEGTDEEDSALQQELLRELAELLQRARKFQRQRTGAAVSFERSGRGSEVRHFAPGSLMGAVAREAAGDPLSRLCFVLAAEVWTRVARAPREERSGGDAAEVVSFVVDENYAHQWDDLIDY